MTTCPKCCGRLSKVAGSAPDIWRAVLICRCTECGCDWQINASITAVPSNKQLGYSACGTASGYKQHRRKNEPACPQCRDAHNAAEQHRAAIRKEKVSV